MRKLGMIKTMYDRVEAKGAGRGSGKGRGRGSGRGNGDASSESTEHDHGGHSTTASEEAAQIAMLAQCRELLQGRGGRGADGSESLKYCAEQGHGHPSVEEINVLMQDDSSARAGFGKWQVPALSEEEIISICEAWLPGEGREDDLYGRYDELEQPLGTMWRDAPRDEHRQQTLFEDVIMQEAPPEIKQVFEMRDLRQYVACEAQCKDPPWAKYSEVESAHGVRAAKMIQDVVDRHCSQISRSGPKFASLPLGRRGTRNQ